MKKRLKYIIIFIVILIIEIIIGKYIKIGFIRNNIGDVLVIPCIYSLIRIIFPDKIKHLSLYVLILGIITELLQLTGITKLLSNNIEILKIILGTTFDLKDIICYIIGYILIEVNKKWR